MISVCCCAIDAKWDVHNFVECLQHQNKGLDFEIVLTQDCRVDDGSSGVFEELQKKYQNFRVVKHTEEDTIQYLYWLMELYETRQRWTGDFRNYLRLRTELYARGLLCDPKERFLWLSSGILYNKAVQAARGDIVVVTPADFLYLFSLRELEEYVQARTVNGYFYSKPGAIWARISNSPKDWLLEQVDIIHKNNTNPNKTKHLTGENIFRDFLQYPSMPEDTYIADFRHNQLISMADPEVIDKMRIFARECFANPQDQLTGPSFHGVHVMTKKSWEYLGGFTEEFYGRAYADDKMTRRGDLLHRKFGCSLALPYEFSIAWIGNGEYSPTRLTYYPAYHDRLRKARDPFWDTHPVPSGGHNTHLHEGFPDRDYINNMSIHHHEKFIHEWTVRFTNGDY